MRPAEPHGARGLGVDELRRLVADGDGPVVGLLGGVSPHDQAVLAEHHKPELRVVAHGGADLLGERESGADVLDPGGCVAEALLDQLLPSLEQASTLIASGCVW